MPHNPHTGERASSTDPGTWVEYTCAIGEYSLANGKWDGVGFAVTSDDPFVGVDLDHCVDDGHIQPWRPEQREAWPDDVPEPAAIVARLASYAELSPSGTGVRIIGRGKLPKSGRKKGDIEMYDCGRYLTMTGRRLPDAPQQPVGCEEAVGEVHSLVWPGKPAPASMAGSNGAARSDDEILHRAVGAGNGEKVLALLEGNTTGFPSPSESDLSFASLLSFWTQDSAQIQRIMFTSGLYRAKYDRADYLPRTIRAAIERRTEFYDWGKVDVHRTDLGNAKRFAHQNRDLVRYCHPWSKWLVWDGRRWAPDDTGAAERLAQPVIKSLWQDATDEEDDSARKDKAKWAARSEEASRIGAMIRLARSQPGLPVLPEALDCDPWLLNCTNGTLDLQNQKLREHRRADLLTKLAPVDYRPEAECPLWISFLEEIFAGDADLIGFMQRLLGYCLTGSTRDHIFPVFYGRGANGKSTLLNAVMGVMGPDYSAKAPAEMLMARRGEHHPTERADLYGRRLVASIETDEEGRLAEALVKDLTGSEPIRARKMRQDFWEFAPTHKLILGTNHRPVIRGTDHAIWRRVRLVPFGVTIADDRQDGELPEKLRGERPGILAWMVRGCTDWLRRGLVEPAQVRAATASYQSEQDVLGNFLDEMCDLSDPAAREKAGRLYQAFRTWAEQNNERVLSQTRFGVALRERGFLREKSGTKWWVGIAIAGPQEEV